MFEPTLAQGVLAILAASVLALPPGWLLVRASNTWNGRAVVGAGVVSIAYLALVAGTAGAYLQALNS
ncbi:hypothetical protein ACVGVM_27840 (plasmid) [Pseudonocardia bannensis]|uniref:Uncharacterized protein n=1 Tax=Pseudonocardia bannensis TaxID=630973 RepID=A0A848DKE2_9PSEU|nr:MULTISPECIES: hypothetical protein [Pseudonocardia]NMH93019.1 hypothetical protein [Pseudonocardia bannensis]